MESFAYWQLFALEVKAVLQHDDTNDEAQLAECAMEKIVDNEGRCVLLAELTRCQKDLLNWAHVPVAEYGSQVKLVGELPTEGDLGFDQAFAEATALRCSLLLHNVLDFVHGLKVATFLPTKVIVYVAEGAQEHTLKQIACVLKRMTGDSRVSVKLSFVRFGRTLYYL